MEKLYRINELSKDIQEKIYNNYLANSNMTIQEISMKDFVENSIAYLGKVYTHDGIFIDDIQGKYYNDLTLEEQKKVYANYQTWFDTLTEKEKADTDDGGFKTFEEYHAQATWTNLLIDTDTFEPIG